ncbi:hypothetical protein GCM10020229_14880 [Kitasatospora albolonga]
MIRAPPQRSASQPPTGRISEPQQRADEGELGGPASGVRPNWRLQHQAKAKLKPMKEPKARCRAPTSARCDAPSAPSAQRAGVVFIARQVVHEERGEVAAITISGR